MDLINVMKKIVAKFSLEDFPIGSGCSSDIGKRVIASLKKELVMLTIEYVMA